MVAAQQANESEYGLMVLPIITGSNKQSHHPKPQHQLRIVLTSVLLVSELENMHSGHLLETLQAKSQNDTPIVSHSTQNLMLIQLFTQNYLL